MSDDLAAAEAQAQAVQAADASKLVAATATPAGTDALAEAAAAAAAAHAAGMTPVPPPPGAPGLPPPPPPQQQQQQTERKTPRRQCRFPGCTKTIKSQGHCQKHGARAKRCKVEGCDKQAQGTHDGMCKRHWKEVHQPQPPPKPEDLAPPPQGPSVFDVIIPASVAWKLPRKRSASANDDSEAAADSDALTSDPMPLVAHLRNNAHLEAAWHRNQERLSRGIRPVATSAAQFESWERQLVMFEIMLMAGIPNASHRDLAHAWGREKGFHNVLVSQICERRGEVDRKKRSDTGRLFSPEQKANFRVKLNKARANKRAKTEAADGEQHAAAADPVHPVPSAQPEAGAVGGDAEGGDVEEHFVDTAANPEDLPPASVEEMVQENAEDKTAQV